MSRPTMLSGPAAALRTGVGRSGRLIFSNFDSVPGLIHGFTLKGSCPETILAEVLPAGTSLCTLRQVHGATVRVVAEPESTGAAAESLTEGDALVTDRCAVALGVRIADCVPILVCDPVRHIVAAVHAGWRGTAAGVLTATLATMSDRFRSRAVDLMLAIGPAIGACCFEVGEEVVASLLRRDAGAQSCLRFDGRRRFVDLVEANRRQARSAGVQPARILSAEQCTLCHPDLFWSYRRERDAAGRMLAFIGWAE